MTCKFLLDSCERNPEFFVFSPQQILNIVLIVANKASEGLWLYCHGYSKNLCGYHPPAGDLPSLAVEVLTEMNFSVF
jgi:hypothetical protein